MPSCIRVDTVDTCTSTKEIQSFLGHDCRGQPVYRCSISPVTVLMIVLLLLLAFMQADIACVNKETK